MSKNYEPIELIIPKHGSVSSKRIPPSKIESYKGIIDVVFGFEADGKNFGQFYFDVKYSNFEKPYEQPRSYDLGFIIPGDCTVNISLMHSDSWRWPEVTNGMTTKGKFPQSLFRAYDYNAEKKAISFNVKMAPEPHKKYYFYLNVEIAQPKGDEKWRLISIDPWLDNPRPNG